MLKHTLAPGGEQIVTFGIQMGIVLRTLEILGTESGVVGVDPGSGVVHINDSIFQASGLDSGSHPSDDGGRIICLERRAKGVQSSEEFLEMYPAMSIRNFLQVYKKIRIRTNFRTSLTDCLA